MAGGVILAALMIYKAWRLPPLDFEYGFREVIRRARGLRFLKFVQGVWESGNMVIPLYGLTFLHSEMEFGAYLSYLGLVGVVGALIVTRLSDRQARRLKYFVPFVLALAVFTMSLATARTLGRWTVLSGLVGVASTMTYPFLFAVVLDRIKDKAGAMIAREFVLNAGRVVGYLVILVITAVSGSMVWGFLFTGLSLLVYPVLLLARKLYMEEDYNPLLPVRKLYEEGKNLMSFGPPRDK
jgi:MFS family permease